MTNYQKEKTWVAHTYIARYKVYLSFTEHLSITRTQMPQHQHLMFVYTCLHAAMLIVYIIRAFWESMRAGGSTFKTKSTKSIQKLVRVRKSVKNHNHNVFRGNYH